MLSARCLDSMNNIIIIFLIYVVLWVGLILAVRDIV